MDRGAGLAAVHGVTKESDMTEDVCINKILEQTKRTQTKSSKEQDEVILLLLLSHFSRVQLCATSQTAAHQAPPSLGFSRQEHWSGLPFPSLQESEK